MDKHLDAVIPIMNELICEYGVFHSKLHFSSSRVTIWMVDDPFNYRILTIDEIIDPNICLAYPKHDYHERAIIPKKKGRKKPTAERASGPRPATQMASTSWYIV